MVGSFQTSAAQQATESEEDDPSLPLLSRSGLTLISIGSSSSVYPLDEVRVLKFATLGFSTWDENRTLRDIRIERRIYQRLGTHPRILRFYGSVQRGVILERYGWPLRKYLTGFKEQGIFPPIEQALQWSREAAEGIAYLHSKGVAQGDIGCHNMLWREGGDGLKISDFGGSSIDGAPHWVDYETDSCSFVDDACPSIRNEIFALGTALFEIWTARRPYDGLPKKQIEFRYRRKDFSDVSTLPVGGIVRKCWFGAYNSADEVCVDLATLSSQLAQKSRG